MYQKGTSRCGNGASARLCRYLVALQTHAAKSGQLVGSRYGRTCDLRPQSLGGCSTPSGRSRPGERLRGVSASPVIAQYFNRKQHRAGRLEIYGVPGQVRTASLPLMSRMVDARFQLTDCLDARKK